MPRGRLIEVAGTVSSGKTSLVQSLAARTLGDGRGVGWVDPSKSFYAPSAAQAGISLDALVLVQPPRVWEIFRAGEHLIRSGALALVILDAVQLPGKGVTSPLFRLNRLALHYHTAVVLLTDQPDRVSSLGSAIAMRLRIERRSYCFEPEARPPFDITGYRIEIEVGKARNGPVGASQRVDVRNPQGIAAW